MVEAGAAIGTTVVRQRMAKRTVARPAAGSAAGGKNPR